MNRNGWFFAIYMKLVLSAYMLGFLHYTVKINVVTDFTCLVSFNQQEKDLLKKKASGCLMHYSQK